MNEIPGKNRAEPHRRLLRHTYQEGPGFLREEDPVDGPEFRWPYVRCSTRS